MVGVGTTPALAVSTLADAQPGGQSVGHPSARFARVLPNDHAPRAGGKMIAQGAANRVDRFFIQRIFAGDAADSVSAKKFSHYSVVATW